MMSAHRTVPQFGPSRRSPFRFAAAALCTAFVLMAASGCTPMRKQGAVPTFPASTMNDAVEAYQKGDCRESIRRFSAALQQQEHPALLNGLGMAYLSCNQPRNAAQAFERAVSISPGSAALHANAGTALYADNDYKSAERQFDAALRIDPTNPEALVGKAGILIQGRTCSRQKEFKAAIDDYTRAVAFIPDLAGAYINRGDVRFLLRETEGACQDLKKPANLGMRPFE
ncbi:tetratricopeptide repeat protein [Bilophila wadsworthia]|uniref:tetratricopeptide repeat protein n=1 Tax=Bilophila wadsworthia TaxID=35833 RepID=UPI00242E71E4|nr:tetratricopeptide repeat protein [Bilophila wadsworthia]